MWRGFRNKLDLESWYYSGKQLKWGTMAWVILSRFLSLSLNYFWMASSTAMLFNYHETYKFSVKNRCTTIALTACWMVQETEHNKKCSKRQRTFFRACWQESDQLIVHYRYMMWSIYVYHHKHQYCKLHSGLLSRHTGQCLDGMSSYGSSGRHHSWQYKMSRSSMVSNHWALIEQAVGIL